MGNLILVQVIPEKQLELSVGASQKHILLYMPECKVDSAREMNMTERDRNI